MSYTFATFILLFMAEKILFPNFFSLFLIQMIFLSFNIIFIAYVIDK